MKQLRFLAFSLSVGGFATVSALSMSTGCGASGVSGFDAGADDDEGTSSSSGDGTSSGCTGIGSATSGNPSSSGNNGASSAILN